MEEFILHQAPVGGRFVGSQISFVFRNLCHEVYIYLVTPLINDASSFPRAVASTGQSALQDFTARLKYASWSLKSPQVDVNSLAFTAECTRPSMNSIVLSLVTF